ncbi:uncharacterized protein PADG_07873 [Paracoccidioides brasiliensis Pb18]|uniref:Uncharacterized protein n=1 Tax=Paracoccidioides brasiliensis (strain Pb18) TaxID=502780 RepID=C1GL87_PARBD|nr:uncharacterized protein PADG_07873 [Paracoccidioides brasiliensis Pb18]EEH43053.2 hypothetical protein PADG_07873 [Paracoccidioides brasiliensis Pb18]ODH50156.1 hypothetical protein GX48_03712 [Paracoccidioides brasiliensis]
MLRTSSELVDAFEPYISHNYIDSSKSARTGYLTDGKQHGLLQESARELADSSTGHQTMEILHEQRR